MAALDRYGRNMGIAFQIADDVLDIWGEERVTGKSLGTDLEKQKLTLPMIHLLDSSSRPTRRRFALLLAEADPELRRRLRPYLEKTGSLEYAWQCARRHVKLGRRRPRLPGGFRRQVGAATPRPLRRPRSFVDCRRVTDILGLLQSATEHFRAGSTSAVLRSWNAFEF